jgi:uncharacterized protein involved in exopolysaccharide biosynthesis
MDNNDLIFRMRWTSDVSDETSLIDPLHAHCERKPVQGGCDPSGNPIVFHHMGDDPCTKSVAAAVDFPSCSGGETTVTGVNEAKVPEPALVSSAIELASGNTREIASEGHPSYTGAVSMVSHQYNEPDGPFALLNSVQESARFPRSRTTFSLLPRRRMTYRDRLAHAWNHRVIITACMVFGIAIGSLYGFLTPGVFSASAVLAGFKPSDALRETEVAILRSDNVADGIVDQLSVGRVLANPRLPRLLDMASDFLLAPAVQSDRARAIAIVNDAMTISLEPGGNALMHLAFQHRDAALSRALLDAALSSEAAVRRSIRPFQGRSVEVQLAATQGRLAELLGEGERLRSRAHVVDIEQTITTALAQNNAIAVREGDLQLRQRAVAAEITKLRELLRVVPNKIFESQQSIRREVGDESRSLLMRLQIERAHVVEQYSSSYTGLAELDRKIKVTEAHARSPQIATDSTAREIRNPAYDTLYFRLTALEPELEGISSQLQEVHRQREALNAQITELGGVSARLAELRVRQNSEQAVERDLSATVSRLRLQENELSTQLEALRWLPQSPVIHQSTIWTGQALFLGVTFGLLAGWALSVLMICLRGRYSFPDEAERHLRLPLLATFKLWRRGVSQPFPAPLMGDLLVTILQAIGPRRSAMTAIHVMATDRQDGGELIAHAMALSLLHGHGASTLLVRMGNGDKAEIESFRHSDGETDITPPRAGKNPVIFQPHAVAPLSSAPDFIKEILEQNVASNIMSNRQVQRLRSLHDVLLVVTSADASIATTIVCSEAADATLLVLRGDHSKCRVARQMCHSLGERQLHPMGLVFAQ